MDRQLPFRRLLKSAALCGAMLSAPAVAQEAGEPPQIPDEAEAGSVTVPSQQVREEGLDSQTDQSTVIQEIVVTARRQEESLQDVPVAVSSLRGDVIENSRVVNTEAITSRVPTLNISVGGSGSGGQVSLRGVGSSNVSAAFDSAVAFDFDGVIISTMRIVQSAFFDAAQIDVLKGPQSLFFGKSATAGVLSIRSADPTPHLEATIRAAYELEEKGHTVEGYISGPITDTLGFRLAGSFNDIDQLYENRAPNVAHPERGEKNITLRGTLDWQPSDRLTANLKVNYVGREADGEIRHTQVSCGPNGTADPLFVLGGAIVIPAGYDCDAFDNEFWLPDSAPPLAVQGPPGLDQNGGVPFNDTDVILARLRVDGQLSDTIGFSSLSGYFDFESRGQDFYGYGGVVGIGTDLNHNKTKQLSQEVRVFSENLGPLNWMFGGYYEEREILFAAAQNAVNFGFFARDPITGSSFDWHRRHYTDSRAYAAFGSFTYDISSSTEISGGIRYTKEKKTNRIRVPYVHAALSAPPLNFIESGFESPELRFSDSNWSPEIAVLHEVSPDVSIYAAYKRGFKSGGIDNSALPSNKLSEYAASGDFTPLIFESETAEGFEVGWKSYLAGRSIRLNGALFYYTFSDLQLQNFDPVAIQYSTTNAGEVQSRGAELDLLWRAPVPGLSFSGAVAYTDAEFTESYVSNAGVDLKGRAPARAPEWAGYVSANYSAPIGAWTEFEVLGLANFSSSYFTDEGTFDDYVQDGYTTFDLTVSVGHIAERWKLSLIALNLTDKIYVNSSSGRPFQGPGGDDTAFIQNRGRQIFLQGSVGF